MKRDYDAWAFRDKNQALWCLDYTELNQTDTVVDWKGFVAISTATKYKARSLFSQIAYIEASLVVANLNNYWFTYQ